MEAGTVEAGFPLRYGCRFLWGFEAGFPVRYSGQLSHKIWRQEEWRQSFLLVCIMVSRLSWKVWNHWTNNPCTFTPRTYCPPGTFLSKDFCHKTFLSPRTFCLGTFVSKDLLSLDVFLQGLIVPGRFSPRICCSGTFVSKGVLSWDVSLQGLFVPGRFVSIPSPRYHANISLKLQCHWFFCIFSCRVLPS